MTAQKRLVHGKRLIGQIRFVGLNGIDGARESDVSFLRLAAQRCDERVVSALCRGERRLGLGERAVQRFGLRLRGGLAFGERFQLVFQILDLLLLLRDGLALLARLILQLAVLLLQLFGIGQRAGVVLAQLLNRGLRVMQLLHQRQLHKY